jgi:hypothetical protein
MAKLLGKSLVFSSQEGPEPCRTEVYQPLFRRAKGMGIKCEISGEILVNRPSSWQNGRV